MNQGFTINDALAKHQAGDLAGAEAAYRRILAVEPANADAWHLCGALCLQTGRAAEAVELIGKAVALAPTRGEFYSHLGAAQGTLGQQDAAISTLRRGVQLQPQSAQSHYNLGTALINAKRYEEAVASFQHAIAVDADAAEAHYNLANALKELSRFDESEAAYRTALRLRPNYMKALINLANVLRAQERLPETIDLLRQAVALDGSYANARLNLGTALRDSGQLDEAVEQLREAVRLSPERAEMHNNLGTALQGLAQFDDASDCFDAALVRDPNLADAHFGRAMIRLLRGDLAGGMADYEWRWKCSGFHERPFRQPRWDGSPLAGRSVLLYAEQGLGDTLQYVRFAENAKLLGGRVVVECQPALVKLLSRMPAIDEIAPLGSPPADFDVHAPLMSLPGILQLSWEQIAGHAYLSADAALVEAWRKRLAEHQGFRIGICWQGNRDFLFDFQRSFPLEHFRQIASLPGVRLVSLQKETAQHPAPAAEFPLIKLLGLDEEAGPFMDTAAVMKNLDLVISADTSLAHLAGALGVPVWVALSAHGDCRWMLNRSDTPWYDSMRLFRQSTLNDWGPVFSNMASALKFLI